MGPFGVWLLIVLACVLMIMCCMVWCFGCFGCLWMCRAWRRQDKWDKYVDDITTVPMASQVDDQQVDKGKQDAVQPRAQSTPRSTAATKQPLATSNSNGAAPDVPKSRYFHQQTCVVCVAALMTMPLAHGIICVCSTHASLLPVASKPFT